MLTRRGTSKLDRVLFLQMAEMRPIKKQITKRRGISSLQSTLYLAVYEISLHTHNGTSGFSSSQFSMPNDELAPSRGVRCLVSLLVRVVTRPVLRS